MSSTSAGDKDPNETVNFTRNGVLKNDGGNVEISSSHYATQGSRIEPSIGYWRSSRRRRNDKTDLQNLRAKKETERRPRERELELEQGREEIELRRKEEMQQQEQELRLKLQQQEDKLRLRQRKRELEHEKGKLRPTRNKCA